MLNRRQEPSPDHQSLEEAADWLIRMSEGELSDSERGEWECWKACTRERARAWGRAQLLQTKLGGLPPSLAMSALDRPSSPERRAALGKLAMMLAILPAGWGSWKLAEAVQRTQGWCCAGPCITHVLLLGLHLGLQLLGLLLKPVKL